MPCSICCLLTVLRPTCCCAWHVCAAGLQPLITQHGPPERLLSKSSSCFVSLAKSILYQQLAGSAAAAIYSRFLAACGVRGRCAVPAVLLMCVQLPCSCVSYLHWRHAMYMQPQLSCGQHTLLKRSIVLYLKPVHMRRCGASPAPCCCPAALTTASGA
jgi:hypothetical protein